MDKDWFTDISDFFPLSLNKIMFIKKIIEQIIIDIRRYIPILETLKSVIINIISL